MESCSGIGTWRPCHRDSFTRFLLAGDVTVAPRVICRPSRQPLKGISHILGQSSETSYDG